MTRIRLLATTLALATLAGCGDSGGGGGDTGGGDDQSSSTAKFEQQIQSREEAALPQDPKFVGDPTINVSCDGDACTAELSTAVAQNIPFAEDRWTISGNEVKLNGGSNIVGFMAADAQYGCTIKFADSGSIGALKPCSAVVAHAHLP
jgi:hypothetical protein